jgi:hypothetical protein
VLRAPAASMITITLQFADEVLQLQRKGMTISSIAKRLNHTEEEVLEEHRMLGISMAGQRIDPLTQPLDDERDEMRDRMPNHSSRSASSI